MKIMNKEEFCSIELSWDEFYWLGESSQPLEVEIHVNSKNEQPVAPHFLQIYAWEEFLKKYDSIHSSILNEALKYYISMRSTYVEMEREWIENMPEVSDTKEMEKMISLNYLCVSWPYDEMSVKISLSYSCSWEVEHGLGIVLENNNVKEVGAADCAIL